MQSPNRIPFNAMSMEQDPRSIGSDLLLGMATLSLLTLLKSGRALSQGLQSFGLLSEEIFRGDRLPNLDFFQPTESDLPSPLSSDSPP